MKWTPDDIKIRIGLALQKQGQTLDDLESDLRGSLHKKAAFVQTAKDLLTGGKGLAEVAGLSAAATGLTGAAGMYGAYKANQDSNDLIMKKIQEKQQYEQAINSLRALMAEQSPML